MMGINKKLLTLRQKPETMEKKNLIEEAYRYVENARDTLRKNENYDPETGSYDDRKYVRIAGKYLWHAVVLALDSVLQVRKDRRTRVNISDYLNAVEEKDKKLWAFVFNGDLILNLSMGYDGILDKEMCDDGFRITNEIIELCAMMVDL